MDTRKARTRVLAYAGLVCGAAVAWLLLAAGSAQADTGSRASIHTPLDATLVSDQGLAGKAGQGVGEAARSAGERGGRAVRQVAATTPVGGAPASRAADEVEQTVDAATAAVTEVATDVDSLAADALAPVRGGDLQPAPQQPPAVPHEPVPTPDATPAEQVEPDADAVRRAERSTRLGARGPLTPTLAVPHALELPVTATAPAADPTSPVQSRSDVPLLPTGSSTGSLTDSALAPAPTGETPTIDALPGHQPATPRVTGHRAGGPPQRHHPSPFATPDVSPD